MNSFEESPRYYGDSSAIGERASAFLSAVYMWMCAGLAITAGTAWYVATSPSLAMAVTSGRSLFWGLAIVQLGIVFVLSARVQKLAGSTAAVLFVIYSALTGATLSVLLRAYTGESIATTFVVAAGTFGGLAMYGTVTKRNLGGLGQFLFMGLIGVVLASIVGLFWRSDAFQFALSMVGVVVFAGLAVYDAQRLKRMALETPADQLSSYAIVGALALYLDFTNLFLFLLRFTGSRRDSWS
jgi:uncharacterized protein